MKFKWLQNFAITVALLAILVLDSTFRLGRLTAAPLHPDTKKRLIESGEYERVIQLWQQARAAGIDEPNPDLFQPSERALALVAPDTMKAIVILVDFSDNPASGGLVSGTPAEFQNLVFSTGVIPTGSMREYYFETSFGKLVIIGQVAGNRWYRMPNPYTFYTQGNYGLGGGGRLLAIDAINAADPDVDYSQFDTYGGDNKVDGVLVIHAGKGAEETANVNDIWSHYSSDLGLFRDGKTVDSYEMMPEEADYAGGLVSIGVIAHEYGHNLGLPDLYDAISPGAGLDDWSLMASGNYLSSGRTPAHLDAYCKARLKFVEVDTVLANRTNVTIPAVQDSAKIFRLWKNGGLGLQYFLVENRQRTGFDSYLPGSGLLVYHVDDAISNNNDQNHYKVALEQADGERRLENCNFGCADGGDPFPGFANNRDFNDLSNPNSRDYQVPPRSTMVSVWNISDNAPIMTVNLDVTWSRPRFVYQSYTVNDSAGGNGNLRPDTSETVNLSVKLKDPWLPTTNVNLRLRSSDSLLMVIDSAGFISTIGGVGDSTASNTSDPFSIFVDPRLGVSRLTMMYLYAWNQDSSYTFADSFWLTTGPTEILLVDDDTGRTYETYYSTALDTLRLPYSRWNVRTQGSVRDTTLIKYPKVIWFTGDSRSSVLTSAHVLALRNYLNNGGKLFLTGQDIAQRLGAGADSVFLRDFLHCRFGSNDVSVVADGLTGDPISDLTKLAFAADGAGNQLSKDYLIPDSLALPVYRYTSGNVAGIRYRDTTYALVFFGFGLEGVSSNKTFPQVYTRRIQVIQRVLNWFNSAATEVVQEDNQITLPNTPGLSQNYPNPFNINTTIRYSLPGAAEVTLEIYNIIGQRVRTLVQSHQLAGEKSVIWDGKDDKSNTVASGIYFYRLSVQTAGRTAENYTVTKRGVLLK